MMLDIEYQQDEEASKEVSLFVNFKIIFQNIRNKN